MKTDKNVFGAAYRLHNGHVERYDLHTDEWVKDESKVYKTLEDAIDTVLDKFKVTE